MKHEGAWRKVRLALSIVGLFAGGTLCAEAAAIVGPGHPMTDFGDDRFRGPPAVARQPADDDASQGVVGRAV